MAKFHPLAFQGQVSYTSFVQELVEVFGLYEQDVVLAIKNLKKVRSKKLQNKKQQKIKK